MKKKNKKNNFFKTLKPILIFSFFINVILLCYVYYLKENHHTYIFTGKDDYLSITSGVIGLNYDINLLEGNGILYINKDDFKIKEINIGYYIIEDERLKSINTYHEKFSDVRSLKETIESITSFNITEPSKKNNLFKNINENNIEHNLYIVMEAKKENNETIVSKINLDVSKIN